MGNDLSSSNNELLKSLNASVMQDSWLKGQYSLSKADQQSELKKIFTVIADNDVNDNERKALEARANVIKAKLDKLEDAMASLKGEITECQEEISKQADAIATLVSAAESKSHKLEDENRKIVKMCIEDVFYEYERGTIGKDAISGEIKKRIRANSAKNALTADLDRILKQLDNKQNEVSDLVNNAANWLDKKSNLESQYGIIKASYNLINANLKLIGNTSTNYVNSDTDVNMPVYSLEKTDLVSDLFLNPAYNVAASNTNYKEGTSEATAPVDIVSTSHSSSTRTVSETKNGDYITTVKETTTTTTTRGYKKNTWDKVGNTLDSNAQLKALSENYVSIIDGLAKGTPAFSFKEGMYALFNQKTGLFKDSGVSYDVSKLNNGQPTYEIAMPGDQKTADFYKKLADKIYEAWGVPMSSKSASNINGIVNSSSSSHRSSSTRYCPPPPPPPPVNTDPITFKIGNSEYAFVIDRNADNAFSGKDEFIGAKQGVSWLDDLKSLDLDGDGVLNKEELKNLKVLTSTYTDNAEVKKDNGFLRDTTTNIKFTMTNAYNLGIEEINLKDLEGSVNNSTGTFDINDSEIFRDNFSFMMNGEKITASRKDDTEYFMNTVYKDAYEKSFTIGLDETTAQNIITEAYNDFDAEFKGLEETFNDLNILRNSPQTTAQTKDLVNRTLQRVDEEENVQLIRASNKASALSNDAKNWTSVQNEVRELAQKQGISIEIEQIKGIYVTDGSLNAKQILDRYVEQKARYDKVKNEDAVPKEAWSAIIECSKYNIKTTNDEIIELLKSGKAKDAKEVAQILKQKQEQSETKEK